MLPARSPVGPRRREDPRPGVAQHWARLPLAQGPQLIGEVGGMTDPFRHPVGEPRLAREHHPTLNGDVRQQGLDRPQMGEVLAQWVLEAMTLAPDHLGPGGLVGLPEDQSTVGLGLHHQEARRGQGQVVDLGEPPAPVGQDQIIAHLGQQPLESRADACLAGPAEEPRQQCLERQHGRDGGDGPGQLGEKGLNRYRREVARHRCWPLPRAARALRRIGERTRREG